MMIFSTSLFDQRNSSDFCANRKVTIKTKYFRFITEISQFLKCNPFNGIKLFYQCSIHKFNAIKVLAILILLLPLAINAQDVPTTNQDTLTGKYNQIQSGISFYPDLTSNTFTVNVPTCSGGTTPTIAYAYLNWQGRFRDQTTDPVPVFDQNLNVQINSSAVTDIAASFFPIGTGIDGSTTRYHFTGFTDVTAFVQANINAGLNTISITDFERPDNGNGTNYNQNFGVGLTIIYECPEFPVSTITVGAGADFFYCRAPEETIGGHSELTVFSFPAKTTDISGFLKGIFGGQANTSSPYRGGNICYLIGSGTPPMTTDDPPNPVVIDDPNAICTTNPTWVSALGTEWDTLNVPITIPAGSTYIAIQANSVDNPAGANCGSLYTSTFSLQVLGELFEEPCVEPSVSAVAISPTCAGNGSDGIVRLNSVTDGLSYEVNEGDTNDGTGTRTTLSAAMFPLDVLTGQTDPTGSRDYTIRVYSEDVGGDATCFTDVIVSMQERNCAMDLALEKTLISPTTAVLETNIVTYQIEVFNQGQSHVDSLVISDYINTGYDPSSIAAPWTVIGNIATLELSASDPMMPIAPGTSATFTISMTVTEGANLANLINHAEISYAEDDAGNSGDDDIDSTPNTDPTDDPGADANSAGTMADGAINGDGTGMVDDGVAGTDEDDADPAFPMVFDLANTKTVNAASIAAAGGTFEQDEDIVFEVNVYNQGNVDAENIVVTDTFPCGLMYDASANAATGWILSGTGGSSTFTVASLAAGADTTILITFMVNPSALAIECMVSGVLGEDGTNQDPFQNYSYITSAEVGGVTLTEDIDSEFDTFTPEEQATNTNQEGDNDTSSTGNGSVGDGSGSEDDSDPANVNVFDLALAKIIAPLELPYNVGDPVTFEICVTSQGNIPSDSVNIIDYIPEGLEYNIASDALGWTGSVGMSTASYTWESSDIPGGKLDFGDQICTDIVLTILAGQTDFVNSSEITSATTIVDDGMGGMTTSLVMSDNDSDFDSIPGDEGGGAEETESDAMTSDVTDPAILGDGSGMPGDETAATDDDSADPALVPIVDFALRKTLALDNTTPYVIGDTVTFLIEVINQGNVGGANITINDYIPANLGFADNATNANWTGVSAGQSDVTAMMMMVGPLEAGDIDSSYIDLIILAGGLNNEDYTNHAEIGSVFAAPAAPSGIAAGANITGFDVDSTPDANDTNDDGADASSADNPETPNAADDYVEGNGLDAGGAPDDGVQATDEDDADPALVAFHDVALTKTKPVGLGPVDVGDVVTFTITIHNQGSSPVDSISIIDYIPEGYTFAPNNNWTASGANAVLTATVTNGLIPLAGIVPGSTQVYPIELTISPLATLDNLENVAEITGSRDFNDLTQDDDGDSVADTILGNDPGGAVGTDSDDVVDGDGTGSVDDEVAATDEDDSDPEGVLLSLYSIGNQVWNDVNNNGLIDGDEMGIEGVEVVLHYYNPVTMTCEIIETLTTDADGLYLFDTLTAGDYVVEISATNFDAGGPLEDF
ncbi:hypothetical protein N9B82_03760, partial [Saprospiraceae bacterium]|nr:hypothetical protein [Saprospiraceae bacterium]